VLLIYSLCFYPFVVFCIFICFCVCSYITHLWILTRYIPSSQQPQQQQQYECPQCWWLRLS
jgi:hypothetical protein